MSLSSLLRMPSQKTARFWAKVAASATLVTLCIFSLGPSTAWLGTKSTGEDTATADNVRSDPVQIKPFPRALLPLSDADSEWILDQLQPPFEKKLTVASCLHLLRVHSRDAQFQNGIFRTSSDILELLVDQAAGTTYFGHPTPVRTRTGVRFPGNTKFLGRAQESHRDQCLGAFAELGIPLSMPLQLGDGKAELRDVLRDSIANFHLDQRELEWTALAYSFYLPPMRRWCNRFGEQFDFDDLAAELMQRPLGEASCGGAHVIYTLTIMSRADAMLPIFSDATRAIVRDWISRYVTLAISRQQDDGSWTIDWHQSAPQHVAHRIEQVERRLLITGHLAECMLYLPNDLQVADEVLSRAGSWLYTQMRKVPVEDVESQLCPYTHAACAVRYLATVSDASRPG